MKSKTKKNQKRTYLIIAAVVAAVVIAGLVIGFYVAGRTAPNSAAPNTETTNETTTTEQEGTVDKPNKTDDTQPDGVPPTTTEPTNASMVIVDASQYGSTFEVRSYVNAVEAGTCTYTFVLGSQKVTKQTETLMNGDTTSCSTLDVSTSEFGSSGNWQLTIDYRATSGAIAGQIKKTVEIKL